MITVFEFYGTGSLVAGVPYYQYPAPGVEWLNTALDPKQFHWVNVQYDAALWPMGHSVLDGVTKGIAAINATPGKFVLVGTSQGAYVASNILDALRYGSLQHRRKDFLAGIAIGNPRKQGGHTGGGGLPDPGGHGVHVPNLQSCEPLWWELAAHDDPACSVGDDQTGQWMRWLWQMAQGGHPAWLPWWIPQNVPAAFHALLAYYQGALVPDCPHGSYWTVAPLAGDYRTYAQIAIDYIRSFA